MIVFFSNCDSVDFHYSIFGQIQLSSVPSALFTKEEDILGKINKFFFVKKTFYKRKFSYSYSII